jgi:hypothetical protein
MWLFPHVSNPKAITSSAAPATNTSTAKKRQSPIPTGAPIDVQALLTGFAAMREKEMKSRQECLKAKVELKKLEVEQP